MIGQAVQVATIEDGTQINFIVANGRLYRVGTDLVTREDVTPGNVTIDASSRVYLTPFSNRLVVQDDVNTPWVASELLASPVVGTKIDYRGNGSAWRAYGPARVWQDALFFIVRERDGEGVDEGTPERRTVRHAWSEPDDPFRGYHQLNYGEENESFDNEWDMVQNSTDPLYAMWPTNLANYYFRDGSIGYITGTVGPDLRTTSTHDAVEEASGTRAPASMVGFATNVFYADVEGRVMMLKIGGDTTDIWRQHRRVVDEAQTRFPDITARTACAALVPELDLYLCALWSPDPTNASIVFPTTMYVFRADSGTYVGEWTIGPLDGDKVAVHAMGTLIGPNGEPRLIVLGKPSLAAEEDPIGTYVLFSLDDDIWHDDDELPDIYITTNRIGYSANTITNVDQATVIVKTVPDPDEDPDDDEEDTVAKTITISPSSLTLAVGANAQLSAVVRNPSGNVILGAAVAWHSDNEAAATVSPTGVVTRVSGTGIAHIWATSGNVSSNSCSVSATVPDVSRVPAAVRITDAVVTLSNGQQRQLVAIVTNAANQVLVGFQVTWASSATPSAAVGTTGIVTGGTTAGTANITATAGAVTSGPCVVTALGAIPKAITIPPTVLALVIGESQQLVATVRDENGVALSGFTVTWESDDTDIATVSSTGLVTAVGVGVANIVARYNATDPDLISNAITTTVTEEDDEDPVGATSILDLGVVEVWSHRTGSTPASAYDTPDPDTNLLVGVATIPIGAFDVEDMDGFRSLLAPFDGICYQTETAHYVRVRDMRDTFRIQTAVGGPDATIDDTAFSEGKAFTVSTLSVKFS